MEGIMYSLIKKYYDQNSRYNDFAKMTQLLFKRHVSRGWSPDILKPIFASAKKKIKWEHAQNRTLNNLPTINSPINVKQVQQFLHLTYHPNDIPRHKIREIYAEECQDTLSKELGITKLTIAYNRPSNIQSIIAKAKLFEVERKK